MIYELARPSLDSSLAACLESFLCLFCLSNMSLMLVQLFGMPLCTIGKKELNIDNFMFSNMYGMVLLSGI